MISQIQIQWYILIRPHPNILFGHDVVELMEFWFIVQDPKGGFSRFFQQKYLTFAEFLPSIGLELLISDSKLAVKHVLSKLVKFFLLYIWIDPNLC